MRYWSLTSLVILLVILPVQSLNGVGLTREYPAQLVRVLDGDTVEIELEVYHLGPRVFRITERLRLNGIQAPEIRGADCDQEREAGLAAQAWLEANLADQSLRVVIEGPDKYGRARGDLVLANGALVTTALIEAGHARAWDGRSRNRPNFCS